MPQRIVCSPRAVDGWLPIRRLSACLLGACVCFTTMLAGASAEEPKAGQGGETLYNGIRLPAQWPPQIRSLTLEPMSPPYLSSPPAVIRIDLGRQLFVDDFLIEDTTLRRVFHTAKYHQNNPVLKPDRPWEQAGKNKAGVNVPVAMPFSDGVW